MSHDYKMVQWNPFKKRFDIWMLGGVALYLVSFITLTYATQPEGNSFTPIQAMIRATGTLAFLMLNFILCIGPLARFSHRFRPFLYNRRHIGVTTFPDRAGAWRPGAALVSWLLGNQCLCLLVHLQSAL